MSRMTIVDASVALDMVASQSLRQIPVEPLRLTIPAVTRRVFSIRGPEPVKRTLGIDMSAGYMNSADRGHGSNIGIKKRRTDHGRNQMRVAVASDRRRVAVGNSKSRHALLSGPNDCLDCIPKTLTETDPYQHIFRSQDFDFVLKISAAADWRLGIEAQRQQPVRQVIRE